MADKVCKYKEGDELKIWSETGNQWIKGKVKSLDESLVTVEYEKESSGGGAVKSVKALPMDSDQLRAADNPDKKPPSSAGKKPEASASASSPPPPLEKRTDFNNLCLGAVVLSALSGMVNAVAILDLSSTVAHHTGNASHFGRLFGRDGFRFLALMVAYVAGAGTASFGDCDGDAVFAGRSSDGLLAVAGCVAGGSVLQGFLGLKSLALLLWAFSQGLQNGITSRLSGLALRTTHMTGALTDAGLVLGQWVQAHYQNKPKPSLRKPILFLSCVLSFATGGFFVSFLWMLLGSLAALAPAAGLAALATGKLTLAELMQHLVTHGGKLKKQAEIQADKLKQKMAKKD